MTNAGEVLKRFRRARALSIKDLAALSRQRGQAVSASHIGKVERGDRKLTDGVFYALADTLSLSDAERQQLQAAMAGTGAVNVVDAVAQLEAKVMAELTALRGEVRATGNLIMDRVDRLRDTMRP